MFFGRLLKLLSGKIWSRQHCSFEFSFCRVKFKDWDSELMLSDQGKEPALHLFIHRLILFTYLYYLKDI